ncbi:MAG: helix-turn-helix domain-containing protein [Rikenellaceae bacterium]
MGAAFLVLTIAIVIFFASGMGKMPPRYRIALNISSYYIAAKLFALSFITVIGFKPRFSSLMRKWSFIAALLFPILVCLTPLVSDLQTVRYIQIFMGVLLFGSILIDVIYFFKKYYQVLSNGEFYSVGGVEMHIGWMIRSVYCMIGAGVFCACFALYSTVIPRFVLFLFLLYFVAVCIYTFNRLLNFSLIVNEYAQKSGGISLVQGQDVDMSKIRFSEIAYENLHKQMLNWVLAKEYCKKKSTIQSAATYASTNRLYLSNYINTTFNCSFRAWVSQLRIDEAKRLLIENSGATITSIAEQVGFQSLTSFTHAFKSIERMSPKEWLKLNYSKRNG